MVNVSQDPSEEDLALCRALNSRLDALYSQHLLFPIAVTPFLILLLLHDFFLDFGITCTTNSMARKIGVGSIERGIYPGGIS